MSEEKDVMVHSSMDAMDKAFKKAGATLETTISEMKKQSSMMADGALQGLGGDAFVEAINNKLVKRLEVLKAKMNELNTDINKAQTANREAEGTAKGRFQ